MSVQSIHSVSQVTAEAPITVLAQTSVETDAIVRARSSISTLPTSNLCLKAKKILILLAVASMQGVNAYDYHSQSREERALNEEYWSGIWTGLFVGFIIGFFYARDKYSENQQVPARPVAANPVAINPFAALNVPVKRAPRLRPRSSDSDSD